MQNVLAVVDLPKIRSNAALILHKAKRPLIAVVKDNAYGHGAEEVAHALSGIARSFAVATVDEGVRLRVAGIGSEILVLTPPLSRREAIAIASYDLTATLSSRRFFLIAKGLPVRAHIAVNTGMNRYGFSLEELPSCLRSAKRAGIGVTGVYSHLYAPEETEARLYQEQKFLSAEARVKASFPDALSHLFASGGICKDCSFDAVRAGLSLYGYLPEAFEGALAVKPAMKIYAFVSHSGVRCGGGAGYGPSPVFADHFYTVRVGYGDGFFREGGLGAANALCMDACVREGRAAEGSRILILDDAAAYARAHGTSVYEVLVNITGRAEFVYRR